MANLFYSYWIWPKIRVLLTQYYVFENNTYQIQKNSYFNLPCLARFCDTLRSSNLWHSLNLLLFHLRVRMIDTQQKHDCFVMFSLRQKPYCSTCRDVNRQFGYHHVVYTSVRCLLCHICQSLIAIFPIGSTP